MPGFSQPSAPHMSVLDNVEDRAEPAEVWVAEASGAAVVAVTLTFTGQPYNEIAMDNELEFRMLAVDPSVQARGVGRPLFARSSNTCAVIIRDYSGQH